jgi:hypothetical protein
LAVSNQGFDIASLLGFSPATFLCDRCLALWKQVPEKRDPTLKVECPICRVKYTSFGELKYVELVNYLEGKSLRIQFDDLIQHSRTLAGVATKARQFLLASDDSFARKYNPYLPMRALFEALLNAQKFVHFVTFGCSPVLMGAIKMVAQRVPVRGIVSNSADWVKEEFVTNKDEAPHLDVRIFERSDRREDWQAASHSKLIVIDGLLLFKGAANLTTEGWRKAARRLDVLEIETNVNEVISFHNNYFSPVWAGFNADEEINIDDLPF